MATPLGAATAALLFLTLASSAAATKAAKFNITEVLSESPEFSAFNSLLSKTNLSEEINNRPTTTVLVVDDSAARAITSLPADMQKNVLAVNVLLDYYDPMKLEATGKKTTLLTTLFQTTGAATNRMGFVNYTKGADEQMAFGSAEPGAPISSQLVKVVACRPYYLSVMQVSAAIIPPSIGSSGKGMPTPTGLQAEGYGSSPSLAWSTKKAEAPEATAPTTEAEAEVQALESSDDASALDDDDPSHAGDGPAVADAPASSQPAKSAGAAKDAPASAGNTVVVSLGLMWLVMLMILNSSTRY